MTGDRQYQVSTPHTLSHDPRLRPTITHTWAEEPDNPTREGRSPAVIDLGWSKRRVAVDAAGLEVVRVGQAVARMVTAREAR